MHTAPTCLPDMPPAATPKAEQTRLRIALTAERLVADQGLGAVSTRMVAREANLKNNSSLNYHFGTMEVLFEFIVQHRMSELENFRWEMIRARPSTAGDWTVAELIGLICLPHFQLADELGRFPYAGFLCEYLTLRYPEGFPWVMIYGDRTPSGMHYILERMRKALPHLPTDTFQRRITNATLLFLNVLRRSSSMRTTGQALHPHHPIVRDTLAQSVGVLTA